MDATTILIMNTAATLALTGLIWMVQVSITRLRERGPRRLRRLPPLHRQITWVVGLLMLCEATAWWLLRQPIDVVRTGSLSGLSVLWSLFGVRPRCFRYRCTESRLKLVNALTSSCSNWLRTAAWTGRACGAARTMVRYQPADRLVGVTAG